MSESSKGNTESELGLGVLCSLAVSAHTASGWCFSLGLAAAVGQQSTGSSQVSQPFLRLTALGLVKRKQSEAEGPMQCTSQLMEIFVDLSGSWIWSCSCLTVLELATAPSGFFSPGSFLVFSLLFLKCTYLRVV